ncbi:MAG: UvrD-helicase domain-containing protein [Phycisphaerales bacterium]
MSSLRHRRILASAGTGKTWQLTTQYLGILLSSGDPHPETILASTFTRAAAGEIRARVLQRLAIASRHDEAGERERKSLREALGLDASAVSAERCLALLQTLLVRLDRLQVRTLDSFFFGIASGSASELGLPVPLEPLDEHRAARLELDAVEAAIASLAEHGPEPLLATLDALTEGHPGRGVESLVGGASSALSALAEEAPESAWSWALPEPPPEIEWPEFLERLETLAIEAETSKELGGKRVTNAIRTTIGLVAAIRDAQASGDGVPLEAWVAALGKGIVKPLAAGDGTFHKQPVHPRITAALGPAIRRFTWEIERIALRRTEASARLAKLVRGERERLLALRGEVTYDRVTRAVGTHLGVHPYSELLERIDAKVEHLLLDEFQDTSRSQWEALRPLASEIAATGDGSRSFFTVGDLKQSIYGWRGGDPEILEHLGDRFEAGRGGVEFTDESLDESWRSSTAVLDAVNAVFESVATNEVARRASERGSAWWGSVYGEHRAHVDRAGVAELHLVARSAEGEDGGEAEESEESASAGGGSVVPASRLRAVRDLVRELSERHPGRRIGIVVRRNRAVAQLLAALRADGLEAVGVGGGSLRDSAAVNAVLEWLRFVEHPDHTIAAFHVGASPLGAVVGLGRRSDRAERHRVASRWRHRLALLGYAPVLESIRASLASCLSEGDQRRWRRLLDEAIRRDRAGWLRPLEFMQAAESIRVGEDSGSSVTVLNIHQAKGLEFDSVICPDLEFTLKPRTDVLVSRNEVGGVQRIVRRMQGLEFVPSLSRIRDESDAMQVREVLCCLYVALTRARDRLFMLVDAPKGNEKTIPTTAAGLIRAALAPNAVEPGIAWRRGDDSWRSTDAGTDRGSRDAAVPESPPRPFAFAFGSDGRTRTRRAAPPSSHEHASLSQAMGMGDRDAADRGTAIHALFETIGFLEDGVPGDEHLDAAIRRALPRREAAWRADRLAEFRDMLAKPAIAKTLARPADGPARVWRERRLVSVEGDAVRQGIIDRLVVVGEPGAWRRADILDFKTDGFGEHPPSEEALAAKADFYRGQLRSYRGEVAKQFQIDLAFVATRLALVGPGEVAEV